ncbi:MoaD family protein [[Eubacterium] cellulosolvens]
MKLKLNMLKPFSDVIGKKELGFEFSGKTIEELFAALVEKYPKMKEELYTANNEVTDYVSIFVNDKPLSALKGMETRLKNGDELLFFVPISGG